MDFIPALVSLHIKILCFKELEEVHQVRGREVRVEPPLLRQQLQSRALTQSGSSKGTPRPGASTSSSPAKMIDSRAKLYKQLSELQNLRSTGILTDAEYATEKETIMDLLKKTQRVLNKISMDSDRNGQSYICDQIWENSLYGIRARFAQWAFLVAQVEICQSPDFVIYMSNNPNCYGLLRRLRRRNTVETGC